MAYTFDFFLEIPLIFLILGVLNPEFILTSSNPWFFLTRWIETRSEVKFSNFFSAIESKISGGVWFVSCYYKE